MGKGKRYYVSSQQYTKAARLALGLTGDKYPPTQEGSAIDSFGRNVQLRQQIKGSFMRLYTQCEGGRWIPSGRFAQHLMT